jgi:protein phosphatase
MKLPFDSETRMWRHGASAGSNEWVTAFEESPHHMLSAPSRSLCAVTDVGKRRSNNEDAYFLSTDCKLWIVADGMGGHAAGEIASALTIQAIVKSMDSPAVTPPANGDMCVGERLARAFSIAHDWVYRRAMKDDDCLGMGSTAIAASLDRDVLHLCHIGNVRAYHWSDGQFRRITSDHSWVWEKLVMPGLLTLDQARVHPQRRIVTQAIGTLGSIKPGLTSLTLEPGDRVLLCSDGLWGALSDEEMGALVGSDGAMRQLAPALVDKANAAGGDDNITVVLYEHDGPADQTVI